MPGKLNPTIQNKISCDTTELDHVSPIPPNQRWKMSVFFQVKGKNSPDYQHCKWRRGEPAWCLNSFVQDCSILKMHTQSYCRWRDLFECLDSNQTYLNLSPPTVLLHSPSPPSPSPPPQKKIIISYFHTLFLNFYFQGSSLENWYK